MGDGDLNKLYKAVIAFFIILFSIQILLTGCDFFSAGKVEAPGTGGEKVDGSAGKKEFVKLHVIYPGEASQRMTDFLQNEFKEKMKSELNLELEVKYYPWSQYWNKKDVMLSAGEPIDWYWDGITNLSRITVKKQAVPLDDFLSEYGKDITRLYPEMFFNATKVNGKVYGIASSYGPSAEKFNSICVRQDLLEAVGMKEIRNTADMELFAEKTKEAFDALKGGAYTCLPALAREYADQPLVFPVDSYMLAVGQEDNKVYSFYETGTFKKVAQKNREWYKKDYYSDEVATKYNDKVGRFVSGRYIWTEGAVTKPLEIINDLRKNAPDARIEEYLLAPEKPKFITTPGNEMLCISSTSRNPERAMMFLNWIYKSKDNYMFTIYGVKDKDYKLENNRMIQISKDTLFYEWMFRNINYMEFPDSVSEEFIKKYRTWDNGAEYSNTFGFTFDSTPVKSEEIKLISIAAEKLLPIATGLVDYDENYPKALDTLKAAGIDKYAAEFQRQLDEFLRKKSR